MIPSHERCSLINVSPIPWFRSVSFQAYRVSILTFGSRSCINSGEVEEAVLIVVVFLACPEGLSVVAFLFPAKHEVLGGCCLGLFFPMVGGEKEMLKYDESRFFHIAK